MGIDVRGPLAVLATAAAGVVALSVGAIATWRPSATGMPLPVMSVGWVEMPDERIPIERIWWCDDPSGRSDSDIYPCKWDARVRGRPASWDPATPDVAVWVRRSQGCESLIGRLKLAPTDAINPPWACLYAPDGS